MRWLAAMEPLGEERSDGGGAVTGVLDLPQWSRSVKSGVTSAPGREGGGTRGAAMEPLGEERSDIRETRCQVRRPRPQWSRSVKSGVTPTSTTHTVTSQCRNGAAR